MRKLILILLILTACKASDDSANSSEPDNKAPILEPGAPIEDPPTSEICGNSSLAGVWQNTNPSYPTDVFHFNDDCTGFTEFCNGYLEWIDEEPNSTNFEIYKPGWLNIEHCKPTSGPIPQYKFCSAAIIDENHIQMNCLYNINDTYERVVQ